MLPLFSATPMTPYSARLNKILKDGKARLKRCKGPCLPLLHGPSACTWQPISQYRLRSGRRIP
jgi:hypothetical protein